MSNPVRPLVLPFVLALFTSVLAQPYKYGCHYFRQHPPAAHPSTTAERALIDDIIARSDTFDILDYDIALDVTDYAGQQLKAATTITFTPLMAGQSFIRFELWDLAVDSVSSAAGPLAFGKGALAGCRGGLGAAEPGHGNHFHRCGLRHGLSRCRRGGSKTGRDGHEMEFAKGHEHHLSD